MNERMKAEQKMREAYDTYCAEVYEGLKEICDCAESGEYTVQEIALMASNLLRKVA